MGSQEWAEKKISKAELLERIRSSYSALEEALRPLSEEQLMRSDATGWTVKDHLAHLAAWELGIAELLQHRSRLAAMQVEEAEVQGKSDDEVNELIYRQNAGLTPAEALEKLRSAQQQMLKAIEALNDEDLYKPYSSYLPEGSPPRQAPVIKWIVGNTYEHFDEHLGWIGKMV